MGHTDQMEASRNQHCVGGVAKLRQWWCDAAFRNGNSEPIRFRGRASTERLSTVGCDQSPVAVPASYLPDGPELEAPVKLKRTTESWSRSTAHHRLRLTQNRRRTKSIRQQDACGAPSQSSLCTRFPCAVQRTHVTHFSFNSPLPHPPVSNMQ